MCPHTSSYACSCRKPKTGLILEYRNSFPDKYKKELFIGDQTSDQDCASALNIPFIMVKDSLSLYNNLSFSSKFRL